MDDAQPEPLFERYRELGDVAALGNVFDLVGPELLALAVRLAPTVGEAEDLVQATFVALLERPRAFRRGERLLPFLIGILARQASHARRRARRVLDAQRVHERAVEAPDRALLSNELDRALAAALERLPELYREVLRQHLLEGRRPVEIALRLRRTPGTVGTQLLRGLELLRKALPSGLAGAFVVWSGARGEAAVRAVVVQRAGALAVTGASLGVGSLVASLGGMLVSLKLVTALCVASLALATWIAWSPRSRLAPADAPAGERLSAAPGLVAPGDAHGERLAVELDAAQNAQPGAIESSPVAKPARAIWLTVRLRGVEPAHASAFQLEVKRGGVKGALRAQFDAHGKARLEVGEPLLATQAAAPALGLSTATDTLVVSAQHPMYFDAGGLVYVDLAALDARPELSCELAPRMASVLTGRVIVPHDVEVGRVQVRVHDELGTERSPMLWGDSGSCDEHGRYSMRLDSSGLHRVRATCDQALPAGTWCRIVPGQTLELPDLVLESSVIEIQGFARLPPSALGPRDRKSSELSLLMGERRRVHVLAMRRDVARDEPPRVVVDAGTAANTGPIRGGVAPTLQRADVQADGSFRLRGLVEGEWELEVHGLDAAAVLPLRQPRVVRAPASDVELWTERCLLTAEVFDAHGPAQDVSVTWTFEPAAAGMAREQSTTSDDRGLVRVVGDASADYELVVQPLGGPARRVAWPAIGRGSEARLRIDVAAARPSTLIVRLAEGSPQLDRARLWLTAKQQGEPGVIERADRRDGVFRFERLRPGSYSARFGPTDDRAPLALAGPYVSSAAFDLALAPGTEHAQLVQLQHGGRLRLEPATDVSEPDAQPFELVAAGAGPISVTNVVMLRMDKGYGEFELLDDHLKLAALNCIEDCLPPGHYTLNVNSRDWLVEVPPIELRAGETTTVKLAARRR